MSAIIRQEFVLAVLGIAAGLAACAVISPLLTSQLFSTRAADPVTLALVPSILLLVVVVACYVPARRAMRIDPASALRAE